VGLSALLTACGGGGGGDGASASSSGNNTPVVRSSDRPNVIFVFTDDQGYADIKANGIAHDILTPNIDKLAATGVRMTDGYVTAPQCTPSRAGLMSGRYQEKFGVDDNRYTPFPLEQSTLAEKLAASGYKTGMAGKWHLEVDANSQNWYNEVYAPGSTQPFNVNNIPLAEKIKYYPESRGFQDTYFGYTKNYRANFNAAGDSFSTRNVSNPGFRVDVVSDAAVSFINRHKSDPFFLYVAYYAPHVPLEATDTYLSRFPGNMPERRRYALAMMSAVDDGVGRIMQTLESYGIDKDTIIFFISDNGAPLGMTKADILPVSDTTAPWDGSLNDPWIGEKGMLTEAGIHVPFIMKWKNHLPEGLVYKEPVISLDASATAAALAGINTADMDGINLIPYLKDTSLKPDRALFWRFWQQSAIRKGKWKYLHNAAEGDYLFDLSTDQPESKNLLKDHPDVASSLNQELGLWTNTLKRPGLPDGALSPAEKAWYSFYFNE
jgi:arylsulfatase A-like enzyme